MQHPYSRLNDPRQHLLKTTNKAVLRQKSEFSPRNASDSQRPTLEFRNKKFPRHKGAVWFNVGSCRPCYCFFFKCLSQNPCFRFAILLAVSTPASMSA